MTTRIIHKMTILGNTKIVPPSAVPTPSPSPTPTPTPPPPPQPSDPTLQIWYNGSDTSKYQPNGNDGTSISQWNDSSNLAHNAKPNGGGANPILRYNIQNSLSCLEFDGTNSALSVSNMSGLANIANASIIFVGKLTSTTGTIFLATAGTQNSTINAYQLYVSGGVHSLRMAGASATSNYSANTGFHLHTLIFDGSQTGNANRLIYRVDGVQQTLDFGATTVDATTNASITYMYFGANHQPANYMAGYIGEILIYTQTLSGSNLSNTESYVKTKWNIP